MTCQQVGRYQLTGVNLAYIYKCSLCLIPPMSIDLACQTADRRAGGQ